MAVKLSPFGPNPQWVDANGNPASGYKLFFYAAGSSTKQNTYTDSTGDTANSNPIVLNSLGQPANAIWFTEGLEYKAVLAPSTDTDPPAAAIWTRDDLSGINDSNSATSQWLASGFTPTYVSATQFTVPGDQTSTLTVDRRVKCTVTAGTVYGYISVSAYTTLTTVTVVLDSGSLDSGLSAVEIGIITPGNTSLRVVNAMLDTTIVSDQTTVTPALTDYLLGSDTSDSDKNKKFLLAVLLGLVPKGQCYLSKDGSNLKLAPYNGNRIFINGQLETIPSAGVTLAPTSSAADTNYYIYAYMNSGTMTLEYSTTTHATDTSTGVEIKSGDSTRTLVGFARTITGPAWVDDATRIYVLSWFNRKLKKGNAAFTANRTVNAGVGPVEVNSELRVNWLSWSDELVNSKISGAAAVTGAATGSFSIGYDGTATISTSLGLHTSTASTCINLDDLYLPSEGNHYSTLIGTCSGGTSITFLGGSNGQVTQIVSVKG